MHPRATPHGPPGPGGIGQYRSREELRADYPELEDEDIRQATAYAAAMLGDESVEIKTAS